MESTPIRAFLVDDEPLAIERLQRLLSDFPHLHVVGSATDPEEACRFLNDERNGGVDVLFLDIQMPGKNGFELLAELAKQPFVIFITAFDEYALQAFQVNSIDYLLKPVEPEHLQRALDKLARIRPAVQAPWQSNPQLPTLLLEMAAKLRGSRPEYARRVAIRIGDSISFLELDSVSHFMAQDKLTYAVVNGRLHMVDQTVTELEERLDPARFLRVHRATLVNLDWIQEVNFWFAGKLLLTLRDALHTKLPVARDRVKLIKEKMGI
ncbi:LytR/AlgR family response regulator transcription factor [Telmatobacter bradus]|uniref:LytR/AlgR family response regulator transcription factor n=1 Tax=Telmatobacter bradus TaxID=474953 RepID=UPI003B42DB24